MGLVGGHPLAEFPQLLNSPDPLPVCLVTDGAGLVLVRKLFDRFGLAG